MPKIKVELSNNFHGTATTVLVNQGDDGELSWSQVLRARRNLCGIAGCECGGNLGERPPVSEAIDYKRVRLIRHQF